MLDYITASIIVLGVSILGCVAGVCWVKVVKTKVSTGSLDPETVKKTIAIKDKYIRELENENESLEKEVRSWTGKYHGLKKGPKIDSPEGEISDIDQFVEANLPDFARQLPPDIAKILLGNKEAVKAYVKGHPEIIQQFLKKEPLAGSPEPKPTSFEERVRSTAV